MKEMGGGERVGPGISVKMKKESCFLFRNIIKKLKNKIKNMVANFYMGARSQPLKNRQCS